QDSIDFRELKLLGYDYVSVKTNKKAMFASLPRVDSHYSHDPQSKLTPHIALFTLLLAERQFEKPQTKWLFIMPINNKDSLWRTKGVSEQVFFRHQANQMAPSGFLKVKVKQKENMLLSLSEHRK
ncbi:hypothetical protein ABVT39_022531, partial [Epinephelus coioides]